MFLSVAVVLLAVATSPASAMCIGCQNLCDIVNKYEFGGDTGVKAIVLAAIVLDKQCQCAFDGKIVKPDDYGYAKCAAQRSTRGKGFNFCCSLCKKDVGVLFDGGLILVASMSAPVCVSGCGWVVVRRSGGTEWWSREKSVGVSACRPPLPLSGEWMVCEMHEETRLTACPPFLRPPRARPRHGNDERRSDDMPESCRPACG